MIEIRQRLLTTMLALIAAPMSLADVPIADIPLGDAAIDRLIQQANISEGPTSVRDLPRYSGARKILIWDVGIELENIVDADADVELIIVPTLAEAMRHAGEVDAIVGFCDADLFSLAPKLVWVQIYSAGAERCMPVAEISSGDVMMSNMQKMGSPVIGEHAIAMMMALARNLPQFGHRMRDGGWERGEQARIGMMPIAGKTLLVAGLGGIGSEVARLGDALGMRVVGTRNSSRSGPEFVDYVGLSHELHELAADADVVVNALPLTDDTKGIFDTAFFAAVKEKAIFINVGRGQTVATDALLAALESGHLSGAGLDVTDPEPLPKEHPLWQLENVIITPHVAGSGGELQRHRTLLAENLRRYIAGERLLNVVDPKKGY